MDGPPQTATIGDQVFRLDDTTRIFVVVRGTSEPASSPVFWHHGTTGVMQTNWNRDSTIDAQAFHFVRTHVMPIVPEYSNYRNSYDAIQVAKREQDSFLIEVWNRNASSLRFEAQGSINKFGYYSHRLGVFLADQLSPDQYQNLVEIEHIYKFRTPPTTNRKKESQNGSKYSTGIIREITGQLVPDPDQYRRALDEITIKSTDGREYNIPFENLLTISAFP